MHYFVLVLSEIRTNTVPSHSFFPLIVSWYIHRCTHTGTPPSALWIIVRSNPSTKKKKNLYLITYHMMYNIVQLLLLVWAFKASWESTGHRLTLRRILDLSQCLWSRMLTGISTYLCMFWWWRNPGVPRGNPHADLLAVNAPPCCTQALLCLSFKK